MNIYFEDFVPEQIQKAKLFKRGIYEDLSSTMGRLNEWRRRNSQLNIINIETILLPNIHSIHEEGSQDTSLTTSTEGFATWHQVVRVWYEKA